RGGRRRNAAERSAVVPGVGPQTLGRRSTQVFRQKYSARSQQPETIRAKSGWGLHFRIGVCYRGSSAPLQVPCLLGLSALASPDDRHYGHGPSHRRGFGRLYREDGVFGSSQAVSLDEWVIHARQYTTASVFFGRHVKRSSATHSRFRQGSAGGEWRMG